MKFKFKPHLEAIFTSEPHYDLIVSGSIDPEDLLIDEHQADAVLDAIDLITEFLEAAEQAEIIEVG